MKLIYIAPASNPHSIRWIKKVNQFIQFKEIIWISYEDYPKFQIDNKINIKYIKLKSIFDISFLKICLSKYDFVHVQSLARYLIPSLFFKKEKLILTAWGSDVYFARKNPFIKILQNKQLKNARTITCDSNQLIEYISKITERKKIYRINFGTDCKIFRPNKIKPSITGDSNFILSTRNFYKVYDIQTLIKAYCSISKSLKKKYKLVLIGKGPCQDELKKIVLENGLTKNVLFPGYVNQKELSQLYSSCSVYVSTALSDAGIASSTSEAMASGAISAITNVRENKIWINDDLKNGLLFNAGDSKDLAKKLVKILKLTFNERKLISKNARKKILNECNLDKEMKKFSELLM